MRAGAVDRHEVRLLVADPSSGAVAVRPFRALPGLLRRGDLLVVNDAATLPAAVRGTTLDGAAIELRLAGAVEGGRASAVLFGEGDHRVRTEDRPPPPPVAPGDVLILGERERDPLRATVLAVSPLSPRLVDVELTGADSAEDGWVGALYRHGRVVQYSYRPEPLPLWAVQTAFAARPWAAEMPSAGRALTWDVLLAAHRRGIGVASLTHAAGLSATGDPALDAALPLPERFEIPAATAQAVVGTRARGGRVVAVGTTVMRALESASHGGTIRGGAGTATLRIGIEHRPRWVDGIVSGIHSPEESHYPLLGSLAPQALLERMAVQAHEERLESHELGDACLILPGCLWDGDRLAA